ncbi:hypothetical protein BH10BAC3_BH10BAC3_26780 [soil metagenome]
MKIIPNPMPVKYIQVDILTYCFKAFLPVIFLITSFKSIGQIQDLSTDSNAKNAELVSVVLDTVAINPTEGKAMYSAGPAAANNNNIFAGVTGIAASPEEVPQITASNHLRLAGKIKFSTGRGSVVGVEAGADFIKTCLQNISGKEIGETATPGFSYSWSPAVGLSAADISNPTANPTISITYTLTKTNNSTGFSNTDRVHVTVDNAAVGADAGGDFMGYRITNTTVNVIGETAIAAFSYAWESSPAGFSSNISNPTVTPLVSTTYTVTKTNLKNGCSSSDEVRVILNNGDNGEAKMAQKIEAAYKTFASRD